MIISHTKGRGKKIHLLLDDEYQITTDVDFWADNCIQDGTDIDEEEWTALVAKINYKKAVVKCYDLLSRRDHSVKELRGKLLRTVDKDYADRAVEYMLELGYLDDEKYAHYLLEYLTENKKMSRSFIRQEMFKRGLSSDLIADVLEDAEIDSVSNAADIIMSKYLNKLKAQGGRDKVIAAMMRKGFSYSDIRDALYRIENDEYI